MNQSLLITFLMLSAGLLGGITNYFRIEEDKKKLAAFLKNGRVRHGKMVFILVFGRVRHGKVVFILVFMI